MRPLEFCLYLNHSLLLALHATVKESPSTSSRTRNILKLFSFLFVLDGNHFGVRPSLFQVFLFKRLQWENQQRRKKWSWKQNN